MSVFEFLSRRQSAKMSLLKWMRANLFNFKHLNLSKMWKLLFIGFNNNESNAISPI